MSVAAETNLKSITELESELDELYRKGEDTRLENRRQLLSLRSKYNSLSKSLDDMGESYRLAIYQQAIKEVFLAGDEVGDMNGGSSHSSTHSSDLPQPYVIKIQAQLCHALHSHEMQQKQSYVFQRRNKNLTKYLQKQLQELKAENVEREEKLSKHVEGEKTKWAAQAKLMEDKVKIQEEEINELRKTLGVEDPSMQSPKSLVATLSESFRNLMDGISFQDLKNTVAHPALESALTPPQLSKSKLWIDLKKEEDEKSQRDGLGELRKSNSFSRRSRHGGLTRGGIGSGSRRSLRSIKSNPLGGSSHHSEGMDQSDHYSKPNRRGLMQSFGIGTSIRNLFVDDEDKDDEDYDEFAVETPDGKSAGLSNTELGQSLLELVNADESGLSPTSKNIKKLSEEVFGL